jgi:hypothetical protein
MLLMERKTFAPIQAMMTDRQMRCLSILRHLYLDPASTPFWTMPPAPRAGKKNTSKPPSDLSTITAQLGTQINGPQQFAQEVDRVWANAKTLATKKAAAHCKAQVDRLYGAWVEAKDRPEDPDLFACRSCAASMHS